MADEPDNPLKRLRAVLDAAVMPRRLVPKSNRTLYLDTKQFETFKKYCDSKGIRPSEVIDGLVGMYLEEVQDDLP